MKAPTLLMAAIVSATAITSCSQAGATFKFYVVVKPEETEKFINAVKEIARENRMEAATAQLVYDTGKVLNVVEARGRGVKLWAENTILSGKESPTICGSHLEPYPDPAQFVILTEPEFFGSKSTAQELQGHVFSRFQQLGYDVREVPVVCGAAALDGRA